MMRPEDVDPTLVEKAAGEIAGAWDGEYIDIPTAREMARYALAAVLPEVQAQALRDEAYKVAPIGTEARAEHRARLLRSAARLTETTEEPT